MTFLIVQPAMSSSAPGNSAIKRTCAKMCSMMKKCTNKKSKESKNCAEGCNPFMACASGNFFLMAAQNEDIFCTAQVAEKLKPINDKTLSCYISDCWHPPEVIFTS
jgi:hypothetical protein